MAVDIELRKFMIFRGVAAQGQHTTQYRRGDFTAPPGHRPQPQRQIILQHALHASDQLNQPATMHILMIVAMLNHDIPLLGDIHHDHLCYFFFEQSFPAA